MKPTPLHQDDENAVDSFLLALRSTVPPLQIVPHVPDNPDLDVLDWAPPPWLARLHRTIGGVGPWFAGSGWGHPSLLPWSEVRPLTAFIRFGEENITFDPADALLLTPDTSGGGVVLVDRDAPALRRFDGQRHRLGAPLTVAEHLDALVTSWRQFGWL